MRKRDPSRRSGAAGPRPGRRPDGVALMALAVAAALAYANTLANPFVFDDVYSIAASPNVRHLWPPRLALAAPPGSGASGRPLVALSLAVNYALGGLRPAGYHALNIALHALAACAAFLLLRGTLLLPPLGAAFGPAARGLAFAAALLWVVHPLHTAALDHVIYRNEILATLFGLVTLECVRRGATHRRPARWYAAAVAACLAAAASKEVAVSFPVLVLVYDVLFLAGSWRRALRQRAALYTGLAATWVLLAVLVARGDRGASVGAETVPPLAYARTELGVVAHYLRLVFWPRPLVIDYEWPLAHGLGAVWAQALFLAVLAAATIAGLLRRRPAAFLGAMFFLVLAPSSSFVPLTGAIAAEHRMYLPVLVPIVLVILGGFMLLRRVLPAAAARPAGTVAVLLAASALAAVTWRRNQDFAGETRLWTATVREQPENPRAQNNLGSALVEEGRAQEAIPCFEAAIRLAPAYAPAHRNLGGALVRLGRSDAALPHIEAALRLDPGDGMTHFKLGQALQLRGDRDAAIAAYEEALRLQPDLLMAQQNLGIALLETRRFAAAAEHFRAGLDIDPDHVGTLINLAWLLATCPDGKLRDGAAAVRYAERAAGLTRQRDPEVLDTLAAAYAEAGRFDDALAAVDRARALAAGDASAPHARLEARRRLYLQHRPVRPGS